MFCVTSQNEEKPLKEHEMSALWFLHKFLLHFAVNQSAQCYSLS